MEKFKALSRAEMKNVLGGDDKLSALGGDGECGATDLCKPYLCVDSQGYCSDCCVAEGHG